jgi:hypothetical protein
MVAGCHAVPRGGTQFVSRAIDFPALAYWARHLPSCRTQTSLIQARSFSPPGSSHLVPRGGTQSNTQPELPSQQMAQGPIKGAILGGPKSRLVYPNK